MLMGTACNSSTIKLAFDSFITRTGRDAGAIELLGRDDVFISKQSREN